MTKATLLYKNLGRNRLRTALTIAVIALPVFVFAFAHALVDAVRQFLVESDKQLRVAVHQKLTYTAWLPQRIRGEIEALAPEGYLEGVCRTSWFGGRVEGVQSTFPSMAVDRDTFSVVYPEYEMTAAEIAAFQNERRAAVVGEDVANEMSWKVGDRVTLVGGLPPFPKVEFVIAAIPPKMDSVWFYFGLDYYNEVIEQATGDPIGVNNFWLRCASPAARQWALSAIDEHFANSDHQTRSEPESVFIAQFLESGGDWVGLAWNVGRLVVLVAVAVAFNTMSMAFRERTRELAVLRALGFSAGRVVAIVLAEGFLLGLLGGAVGVVPIYLASNVSALDLPQFGQLQITAATLVLSLSVAIGCGLLAALLPAIMASRLNVAAALRKVA